MYQTKPAGENDDLELSSVEADCEACLTVQYHRFIYKHPRD